VTSRRGLLGAAALAAYVIAAVATVRLTDHHVRPLFEGIGPAPPYQWVDPPSEFASGNVKPHAVEREVALGPVGSPLTSLSSGDAQLVVNIPDGAMPPRPGDTAVVARFEPLAPKQYALPPVGLRADGNVYRVSFTYKPSGQAVEAVPPGKEGSLVMGLPEPGVALLYSADGKRWEKLATQPVGGPTTLGTRFERTGYYLGAASPTTGGGKASSTGRIIAVVAIVVGVAVALGLGPVLVRRWRRPASRSEQRRRERKKR
jgi:hypothetical protein